MAIDDVTVYTLPDGEELTLEFGSVMARRASPPLPSFAKAAKVITEADFWVEQMLDARKLHKMLKNAATVVIRLHSNEDGEEMVELFIMDENDTNERYALIAPMVQTGGKARRWRPAVIQQELDKINLQRLAPQAENLTDEVAE